MTLYISHTHTHTHTHIYIYILQIGTGVTNALIAARKVIDKSFAGEAEDVPILSTSVAYGVYMSVSSNLRYVVSCFLKQKKRMSFS